VFDCVLCGKKLRLKTASFLESVWRKFLCLGLGFEIVILVHNNIDEKLSVSQLFETFVKRQCSFSVIYLFHVLELRECKYRSTGITGEGFHTSHYASLWKYLGTDGTVLLTSVKNSVQVAPCRCCSVSQKQRHCNKL